jgi:hypothetical protein
VYPAAEISDDTYAIPFAGRKFVEKANPGPRPEHPIEIYEFEGFELKTLLVLMLFWWQVTVFK